LVVEGLNPSVGARGDGKGMGPRVAATVRRTVDENDMVIVGDGVEDGEEDGAVAKEAMPEGDGRTASEVLEEEAAQGGGGEGHGERVEGSGRDVSTGPLTPPPPAGVMDR
jgi:hypothetical protein